MPKLRCSGGRRVIACPSSRISPEVGCTKPAIAIRIVVLPDPEGPSRVTNSPRSICSVTSSTAATLP
jgi:hypothetical protein